MLRSVLTAAQMGAAEHSAMANGRTAWDLMQQAGTGAAQWVKRVAAGRTVTVLCGPGNNGGDGYVIAQNLVSSGHQLEVVAPAAPATPTAIKARQTSSGSITRNADCFGQIIVDCLFGYGLSRSVQGVFAELLERVDAEDAYRIAVDMPSAVLCDTGALVGPVPQYDLTLALGALKPAHYMGPDVARLGTVRLIDIGLPMAASSVQLCDRPKIEAPQPASHKYTRGLVSVMAGQMPGAAVLAAGSAARAGAGYVKVHGLVAPSALPHHIVHDPGTSLDRRTAAVLVGPGLGRGDEAYATIKICLRLGKRIVLDADALHLLDESLLSGASPAGTLATPHDGELQALCQTFGVRASTKLDMARLLNEATGMAILAKGPDTILAASGAIYMFPRASSWLSTAGSGDVLSGIAAARLAVTQDPIRSACEAFFIHSEAARLAGPAMTASDLEGQVGRALAHFI